MGKIYFVININIKKRIINKYCIKIFESFEDAKTELKNTQGYLDGSSYKPKIRIQNGKSPVYGFLDNTPEYFGIFTKQSYWFSYIQESNVGTCFTPLTFKELKNEYDKFVEILYKNRIHTLEDTINLGLEHVKQPIKKISRRTREIYYVVDIKFKNSMISEYCIKVLENFDDAKNELTQTKGYLPSDKIEIDQTISRTKIYASIDIHRKGFLGLFNKSTYWFSYIELKTTEECFTPLTFKELKESIKYTLKENGSI